MTWRACSLPSRSFSSAIQKLTPAALRGAASIGSPEIAVLLDGVVCGSVPSKRHGQRERSR